MSSVPLKMIAASSINKALGYRNKLPWNLKGDMNVFRKKTVGNGNNAVVMGMNTWRSLPTFHLPQRDNYVLSRNHVGRDLERMRYPKSLINHPYDHVEICEDKHKMLELLENRNYDDVWIIGGAQIYEDFICMDQLKEIHMTTVFDYVRGDAFFPKIPSNFRRVEDKSIPKIERENSLSYVYETYVKTNDNIYRSKYGLSEMVIPQ